MIVITTLCAARMRTSIPCPLTFWKYGGRKPCSRPILRSPSDGPSNQANIPARAPTASAIAISGCVNPRPKCLKRPLKACITPAVKLICPEGITQAIASVGKMKTARTTAIARNTDLG